MRGEPGMSPLRTYTSRRGEVPCGDADLYAFLTDMRNLQTVVPDGLLTDWQATEDHCSFKIEKAGRITVSLSEALPHSMITYDAETFLTGKMSIQVSIEYISGMRSAFHITAGVNMNPILKMMVGDSAGRYLDSLIDAIEAYSGYDKVRGCNQSL
ncbi:MAG: hypothetical protein IH592_00765 [Bacteroidales bacterium]|nr:hypothetical protein [Bacteroidales bacterium]